MPWTDTLSNEDRSHAASKGWDRLPDAEAAAAISKSYRELERIRPAPPAVPATAAEYTFPDAVKDAPAPTLAFVRQLAADLHLPIAAAGTLAERLVGRDSQATTDAATLAASARATSEAALKTSWGADYAAKEALAAKGFAALGLAPEAKAALEATLGVDKAAEFGLSLGLKMGEATLLKEDGGKNVTQPAMTRQTALDERNSLMTNNEFLAKFSAGDVEAVKKIGELSEAIIKDPNAHGGFVSAPANYGRVGDGAGHEKIGETVAPNA